MEKKLLRKRIKQQVCYLDFNMENDYIDNNFIRVIRNGSIYNVDMVDFLNNLHNYLKLGVSGASLGYRKIIDLEKLRKVLK